MTMFLSIIGAFEVLPMVKMTCQLCHCQSLVIIATDVTSVVDNKWLFYHWRPTLKTAAKNMVTLSIPEAG